MQYLNGDWPKGKIGFLIERSNPYRGSEDFTLEETPAHTNQSHEPRLEGWCGTYNDTATHARGLARVARVCSNGRIGVVPVEGVEAALFLREAGYPELITDEMEEALAKAQEPVKQGRPRKADEEKRISISTKVDPATMVRLTEIREATGESIGQIIDRWATGQIEKS